MMLFVWGFFREGYAYCCFLGMGIFMLIWRGERSKQLQSDFKASAWKKMKGERLIPFDSCLGMARNSIGRQCKQRGGDKALSQRRYKYDGLLCWDGRAGDGR